MTGLEPIAAAIAVPIAAAVTGGIVEGVIKGFDGDAGPLLSVEDPGKGSDCCLQLNFFSRGNNSVVYRNVTVEARVVVNDKGELEQQRSKSCCRKLLHKIQEKFCCCLGTSSSSKNDKIEQNKEVHEKVLEKLSQYYGPDTAKLAPIFAGIDWERKQQEGGELHTEDLIKINQAAQYVNKELREIKKMLKEIKFYMEAQQQLSFEEDASEEETPAGELHVLKSGHIQTVFDAEKIKKGVLEAHSQNALSTPNRIDEDEIDQFVSNVRRQVAKKIQLNGHVTTVEIRSIVISEMQRAQFTLAKPTVIKQVEREGRSELLNSLATKERVHELTPEEVAHLIKLRRRALLSSQSEPIIAFEAVLSPNFE